MPGQQPTDGLFYCCEQRMSAAVGGKRDGLITRPLPQMMHLQGSRLWFKSRLPHFSKAFIPLKLHIIKKLYTFNELIDRYTLDVPLSPTVPRMIPNSILGLLFNESAGT